MGTTTRAWLATMTAVTLLIAVPASTATTAHANVVAQQETSAADWTDWQQAGRTILRSKEHYSDGIDRCLRLYFRGKFRFQWKPDADMDAPPTGYRRLQLVDPELRLTSMSHCGRTSKPARLRKVQLTQSWRPRWLNVRNECDLNPSIGISAPWGVSFSVSPTCDDDEKLKGARYTTSPGGPDTRFFQVNEGVRVRVAKTTSRHAPLCLDYRIAAVAYPPKGSGGSGSASIPPISGRICAKKKDSRCPGDPTCANSGVKARAVLRD
jgi:hypothetical protein